MLIENGADVNARSKRGLTPLNLSAIKGHTSTLKVLIGNPNIDLSAAVRHWRREGGREEKNYGCKRNFLKFLLAQKNCCLSNLEIFLCIKKFLYMYYFLKLTLIHFSLQDSEGNTPLHCAVLAQKLEAIVLLLEAGADPSLVNFRLFTPLHEAARIGFLPYVKPHPLIKQQKTTPSHR